MNKKKPLVSKYNDGSARFGVFDIDIKCKHGGFKRYIIQSLLAGFFVSAMIFGLFLLIEVETSSDQAMFRYLILSSIAASTFLVFGAPRLATSSPINVFFGHFIAVIIGISIHKLMGGDFAVAGVLAVSLATFFMIVLDFEHPPAAGTALALSIYTHYENADNIFIMAVFILTGSALLGLIHKIFYVRDGFKAMTGVDDGTLTKFKHYRDEKGQNVLLTVQDLAEATPKDIYKAMGDSAKYFCHKEVNHYNFKDEYCPIFQLWIDQAKEQVIKEEGYSKWTLRDLF